MKTWKLLSATAIIGLAVFFRNDITTGLDNFSSAKSDDKNPEKETVPVSAAISVKKVWNMPEELLEISGISAIDDERFACVQDEMGTVYIYNTTTSGIEKKIPFTNPGDFEGIAVVDKTIWIVRSDGVLFELDTRQEDIIAKDHKTSLTAKHNIEGLCYDKANNRLLLASKDGGAGKPAAKGIYAFDLSQKKLITTPVFEISLDPKTADTKQKKKGKQDVKPSGIAIHPLSGDMYITDGPKSRLLILDNNGGFKSIHNLGKEFQQPEGIAFRENGDLFISNEGTKTPGNIIQVAVKQ